MLSKDLCEKPISQLTPNIEVVHWGLIPYQAALEEQLKRLESVASGSAQEAFLVCRHPPVVTVGRGTKPGDLFSWTGEVVEVQRGGRATYHGPNQVVVYPILKLDRVQRDLHVYLRTLEEAIVKTLKEYGVNGEGRQGDATGVWVGNRKIASIGVAVKQWVSYHGLAFNLDHDPAAFRGINPCGFTSDTMISLEELLGQKVDREQFEMRLCQNLGELF